MKDTGPNQKIVFSNNLQKKKRNHGRFIAIMLTFLICGGAISMLFFLSNYNFDLKTAFGGNAENETEPETRVTERNLKEVNTNLLLFCALEDRTRIDFIALVNIKAPENEITVFSFSPSEGVTVNGTSTTLGDLYYKNGVKALEQGVKAFTGITPDKYIYSNETDFKSVTQKFGKYKINIPQDFEYRGNDFTLVLPKGEQYLAEDTLLRYIRCVPEVDFVKGMRDRSEIIRMAFSNAFSAVSSENLLDTYSSLANRLSTDISIVDFSAVLAELEAMADSDNIKFTVVSTAAEYPGK